MAERHVAEIGRDPQTPRYKRRGFSRRQGIGEKPNGPAGISGKGRYQLVKRYGIVGMSRASAGERARLTLGLATTLLSKAPHRQCINLGWDFNFNTDEITTGAVAFYAVGSGKHLSVPSRAVTGNG
jgi:hypothetical protein